MITCVVIVTDDNNTEDVALTHASTYQPRITHNSVMYIALNHMAPLIFWHRFFTAATLTEVNYKNSSYAMLTIRFFQLSLIAHKDALRIDKGR